MIQLAKPRVKVDNNLSQELERHCVELFNECLFDLTTEEQEIWLWNATVEMERIKRRRDIVQAP